MLSSLVILYNIEVLPEEINVSYEFERRYCIQNITSSTCVSSCFHYDFWNNLEYCKIRFSMENKNNKKKEVSTCRREWKFVTGRLTYAMYYSYSSRFIDLFHASCSLCSCGRPRKLIFVFVVVFARCANVDQCLEVTLTEIKRTFSLMYAMVANF